MAERGLPAGHDAVAAERREKALELRQAGMSYYYIGKQLDVSKATAWKDVQRAIKEIQENYAETAMNVLTIELKRLDRLLLGLWQDAIKGDKQAVDRVVKIMERKAKYLGLDAPEKMQTYSDIDHNINITFGKDENEHKPTEEV